MIEAPCFDALLAHVAGDNCRLVYASRPSGLILSGGVGLPGQGGLTLGYRLDRCGRVLGMWPMLCIAMEHAVQAVARSGGRVPDAPWRESEA